MALKKFLLTKIFEISIVKESAHTLPGFHHQAGNMCAYFSKITQVYIVNRNSQSALTSKRKVKYLEAIQPLTTAICYGFLFWQMKSKLINLKKQTANGKSFSRNKSHTK
jgi:hypothetical protein